MASCARPAAALAVILSGLLGGEVAEAACMPPSPPDPATRPAKLVPPVKGPCVGAKPGTPGCMGYEDYSFNDEVRAFNAKVPAWQASAQAYVAKLNDYVKAASDYARCEAESLQSK